MLHALNTACTLAAVVIACSAVVQHLKNYRKPLDQRCIVRILFMLPLFASSAHANLYAPRLLAETVNVTSELYEAFVIYTFYTYLTVLLGGERAIIYNATGRAPVRVLGMRVDVSDPQVYVRIKRSIMQFCYARPVVALLAVLTRNTSLSIVVTVFYNISITLALNALMVFYACLKPDLAPYRVVLKFLSIKSVVFFSYWQGLAVAICAHFHLMTNSLETVKYSLLCVEAVPIACLHYKAFPCSDYSATMPFGFARLRLQAAAADVFGVRDLCHDFLRTFGRGRYGPRDFDSVEAMLDHPDSQMRAKRIAAGLRYRDGGSSKYWLPPSSMRWMLANDRRYGSTRDEPLKDPHRSILKAARVVSSALSNKLAATLHINERQSQSSDSLTAFESDEDGDLGPDIYASDLSAVWASEPQQAEVLPPTTLTSTSSPQSIPSEYDSVVPTPYDSEESLKGLRFTEADCTEDEDLFSHAREIYGDYNYPVITVRPCEPRL